jgi:hypothetical protein
VTAAFESGLVWNESLLVFFPCSFPSIFSLPRIRLGSTESVRPKAPRRHLRQILLDRRPVRDPRCALPRLTASTSIMTQPWLYGVQPPHIQVGCQKAAEGHHGGSTRGATLRQPSAHSKIPSSCLCQAASSASNTWFHAFSNKNRHCSNFGQLHSPAQSPDDLLLQAIYSDRGYCP